MNRLLLFCLVVFSYININACEPLVNVEQGALRGKEVVLANGKVYHRFSGVPYAKPPVGDLRFKVNYAFLLLTLALF